MNYSHLSAKVLLCLIILVAIDYLPSYGQEDVEKKTKVTIIKESYDADGNKTVQKIVKEGAEADAIDLDRIAEGNTHSFDLRMPQGNGWLDLRSLMDSMDLGNLSFPDFGDWQQLEGFPPLGASKPRLGIRIKTLQTQTGVLVSEVLEDSPAMRAGIKDGDIIRSVDGKTMDDSEALVDYINEEAGDVISVDVLRDEKALTFEVELSSTQAPDSELPTRKL